jgi:hypothetical protein
MRMLSRTSITLTAVGSALAMAATTTAVASPPAPSSDTPSGDRVIANGVGAPFQIARRGKTVFYADGGAGTLNKITKRGPKLVARVPGISGVEFSRNRKVMAIASGGGPGSRVTLVRRGKRPIVAAVGQYEQNVNPDKNRTYGIVAGGSAACTTQVSAATGGGPATYTGLKDSHPYQVAPLRRGAFAVAEAGGNGILRVGPKGGISLLAMLPSQPVTFTPAQAAALGAPACAGATYAFEPVPTDVERIPGGGLLVSTLPGGPEDPSLGARGSVYRIKSGVITKVAGGFLGATNVAVVRGRVYVTELFGGKITKLGKGGRFTRVNVGGAVSVEATRKHLYYGVMGGGPSTPGKIVRIRR